MLTVITPTCDQPTGIALCEFYMARQTLEHGQWIVADDGIEPARLSMGQIHIKRAREPGCTPAQSLCRNLLGAIARVDGDVIVVAEHDDWLGPTHLETIVAQLERADIAGDPKQRYYNVDRRCWRLFDNVGASLCQTAFRRELLPKFERAVRRCLANGWFHVDRIFWDSVPDDQKSLERTDTVVGIKGLPGRPGIGIGHRPAGPLWNSDRDGVKLRSWIGDDASLYEKVAA